MTHKEILITSTDVNVLRRTIPAMIKWLRKIGGEISCSIVYVYDAKKNASANIKKKKQQLEEIASEISKSGFNIKGVRLVKGSPADEIARIAREENAYALLVGVNNRSTLMNSGDIVEGIIKRTPCPVVVFKPKLLKFTERVSLILSSRFKKLSNTAE